MNRPNGSGTVFKRGSVWYAQITDYWITTVVDGVPKGKPHRKTKGGFKTKREAVEYIATMKDNCNKKSAPTLIELWERIERTDVPKLSRPKQSSYNNARKRIETIIGKRIDEVTIEDMQKCVDGCDTYYPARDIKTLLSKMYERSIPDGFVSANIAQYLVLPRLEDEEPVPFDSEEIKVMWSSYLSGDEFVGYMLIMIYTGMMPEELRNCKTEMINFEKYEIIGCGRKTKKRKDTPIVFAECVTEVLHKLADGREYLCPMEKTKFYKEYHEAIARMKIRDLPPYSCRHTTATEAAKMFASTQALKELMRHSRIATTQRYVHIGSPEAHSAIDSISHYGANIGANT